MVENYIETEYFETHVISEVLRMRSLLESSKVRIPSNDGFNNDVINSLFCFLTVMAK